MPCMPGLCCPPHVHALAARPGLPVSGSGTPGATQSVPCMLLWLRLHPVPCGTLEGPLPMPWALGQAEQDHSSWPGKRGAGLGLGLLPSPREAFSASIQWPRSCPQVTRLPSNASLGQPRAGPVPLPGAVTRKHGQPGPLLCPFGRVLSPPALARGLFLWGGITSGRLESWPHPGRLLAGRRTRRPGRNHQAPSLVPHRSPERPLGLSWDG